MAVTRRGFLTEVAAAGGVSLAYEAIMTDMSSWMQGAFESAREVATALHRRVLAGK